ncbi:hypothetical protein CVT24_000755 [Panaeolus cyanescens]|uniref:3'-5' exonuclease n=1 Tax=Panaeolus cyanescens TaxID=181874 RepID=A0A409YCS2_9AGAR|nr:hypothetical protein CVT24_000755 [Panaeolus cyanescens]
MNPNPQGGNADNGCNEPVFFTFSHDPLSFAQPATPSSTSTALKRPVGRPKGSTKTSKTTVIGPKRRPGRPTGSGKRKEREETPQSDSDEPAAKRGPGRPRKGSIGQVQVTDLQGQKIRVPGNGQVIGREAPMFQRMDFNQVPKTSSESRPIRPLPSCAHPISTPDASRSHPTPSPDCHTPLIPFLPGEDPQRIMQSNDDRGLRQVEGVEGEDENLEGEVEGEDEIEDEAKEEGEGDGDPTLEDQASGEGIGVDESENRDNEDDDEQDPDQAPPTEPGPGTEKAAPRRRHQRSTLPPWLHVLFVHHVAEAQKRNAQGLPLIYDDGSFWFPQKSIYLILRKSGFPIPSLLYNPRFYLWDPLSLENIPCPFCKTTLGRFGHIPQPRRIIDFDAPFWIIGFRYRCPSCVTKSNKRNVTFQSWDSRIIKGLSRSLAEEFPAQLSWRGGMSKSLAEWMRSCFQNGMGAKQFTDCLLSQHILHHDIRRLQYLYALIPRTISTWVYMKRFSPFLPYDDTSPEGLHGFIPSATWFRSMYDKMVEEHCEDILQYTSMLPLNVGALDHSYKFTKHVARVNGQRIFFGLLTVTNENGEIRSCHLVTTSGHSQSAIALSAISQALSLYGHAQPVAMYTDNVSGDMSLLDDIFHASLSKDVIPVADSKYTHLAELEIPPDFTITVAGSSSEIDAICKDIQDDIKQNAYTNAAVGFDSEWNVNYLANDRIRQQGPTTLVQLAYRNSIYIFQIGDMIAQGTLPKQLSALLQNPAISKVGRMIDTDLANLHASTHSSQPFLGIVDLAKLAKQRCVVHNIRTTSLADLSARVLHRQLSKNPAQRISNAWENPTLTESQIKYAALDAFASLQIFEALICLQPPMPLNQGVSPPHGTTVMLFNGNKSAMVASGFVGDQPPDIPANEAAITVTEVMNGAAKLPGRSHRNQVLEDFGKPPFVINVPRSHVLSYEPIPYPPPPTTAATTPEPQTQAMSVDDSAVPEEYLDEQAEESERDRHQSRWSKPIRSRIIKDAFHLMNMFNIPSHHGLRREFSQALRDALFIPDPKDAGRISMWGNLQNPPVTFNDLRRFWPKWLWMRCKRLIPPPEILYGRVEKVLKAYGAMKDAVSQEPLFNDARWKIADNVLDMIKNGYVSDPGPDVPLYSMIGLDKKTSLPLYRCFRGTNVTEGGVHTHLRPHLPSGGVSIRHTNAALMDFVLHHNLRVGLKNTTGQTYQGHYSIWIVNEIQDLTLYLKDYLDNPSHAVPSAGWINVNLYKRGSETPIGVLPVPSAMREQYALSSYEPLAPPLLPARYDFLAKIQGTRKPILPIHTTSERSLFRSLMETNMTFNGGISSSLWPTRDAVALWNVLSDKDDSLSIFYKLPEQLKSYLTKWKTIQNIRESLSLTKFIRQPIVDELTDLDNTADAPSVPMVTPTPHTITTGYKFIPSSYTDLQTSLNNSFTGNNLNDSDTITVTRRMHDFQPATSTSVMASPNFEQPLTSLSSNAPSDQNTAQIGQVQGALLQHQPIGFYMPSPLGSAQSTVSTDPAVSAYSAYSNHQVAPTASFSSLMNPATSYYHYPYYPVFSPRPWNPAEAVASQLVTTSLRSRAPVEKARSQRHCVLCGLKECNGKMKREKCWTLTGEQPPAPTVEDSVVMAPCL